jgi:AraC-like DNA-binding protein
LPHSVRQLTTTAGSPPVGALADISQRHAATKAEQPLSVIAYACGFRDYTHFARAFRNRFGYPPGAARTRTTGNDSVGMSVPSG